MICFSDQRQVKKTSEKKKKQREMHGILENYKLKNKQIGRREAQDKIYNVRKNIMTKERKDLG